MRQMFFAFWAASETLRGPFSLVPKGSPTEYVALCVVMIGFVVVRKVRDSDIDIAAAFATKFKEVIVAIRLRLSIKKTE